MVQIGGESSAFSIPKRVVGKRVEQLIQVYEANKVTPETHYSVQGNLEVVKGDLTPYPNLGKPVDDKIQGMITDLIKNNSTELAADLASKLIKEVKLDGAFNITVPDVKESLLKDLIQDQPPQPVVHPLFAYAPQYVQAFGQTATAVVTLTSTPLALYHLVWDEYLGCSVWTQFPNGRLLAGYAYGGGEYFSEDESY